MDAIVVTRPVLLGTITLLACSYLPYSFSGRPDSHKRRVERVRHVDNLDSLYLECSGGLITVVDLGRRGPRKLASRHRAGNQFSVLINRLGTFYGQCSEICGILHSSMPIVVESISLVNFLS